MNTVWPLSIVPRFKNGVQNAAGVLLNLTQGAALTAQDTATVDGTYGAEEQGVIGNNRTRIAEIETVLKNAGLLP